MLSNTYVTSFRTKCSSSVTVWIEYLSMLFFKRTKFSFCNYTIYVTDCLPENGKAVAEGYHIATCLNLSDIGDGINLCARTSIAVSVHTQI